jgi:hypothetical protein
MKRLFFLVMIPLLFTSPARSQQGTKAPAKTKVDRTVKAVAEIIPGPPIPQPKENDLADENLYGKVKSVKYYDVRHTSDTPRVGMSFEYNEVGNRTWHKYYSYIKDIPGSSSVYKYAANGKISEIIDYRDKDGHPVPESSLKYTYDDYGNETELTEYNIKHGVMDFHTVSYYDSSHHLLSKCTIGRRGDTSSVNIYEHGNMVKRTTYGTWAIETREYKYNEQGHAISEDYYATGGEEPYFYKNSYDENGRKVREEYSHVRKDSVTLDNPAITTFTYDRYGNTTSLGDNDVRSTFWYEYDKHGNWIKKYSVYDGHYIELREIEYYP